MNNNLAEVLTHIGEVFKEEISHKSGFCLEVDIGKQAEKLGYSDIKEKYRNISAFVPLKQPLRGMKVRMDGRTFVNYAQSESGVVIPGYIAKEAGLSHKTYEPNDSMIRILA